MRHVFAILSLFLLLSCATTDPFTLEPYVTDGTELVVNRGKTLMASSDGDVTVGVSVTMPEDRDSLSIGVSVTNNSASRYLLEDSQLEAFSGDMEAGEWTSLGVWDADRYYSLAVEEARQRENSASAFGAVAIISSAHPGPGGPPRRGPSAAPVMTGIVVSSEIREIERANDSYLSTLSSNLLFTSHIASGETYTGILFAYPDWKKDDFKLVFHGKNGKDLEFIYLRSYL